MSSYSCRVSIIVDFKSPKVFLPIVLVVIIFFIIFLIGFGVTVPSVIFPLLGFVFLVATIFLLILLHKKKEKEPMKAAIQFCQAWILDVFHQNVKLQKIKAYGRYFPPNPAKFYGLIFERSDALRGSQNLAIVVKKTAATFTVEKIVELADGDDLADPFVVLSTKYAGAPVEDIGIEPWTAPLTDRGEKAGTTVNIRERDQWTEEKK